MKRATKIWLIAAGVLVLMGALIFLGALVAVDFDFRRFSTVKFETNIYEIGEAFDQIDVDVKTADVIFAPSDDGTCKVVCRETETIPHCVGVEEGALRICAKDNRKWYDYLEISFESVMITVYLPETEYTSISIHTDTGDVEIPVDMMVDKIEDPSGGLCGPFTTGDLTVQTETGDLRIGNISANVVKLETDTGDIELGAAVSSEGVEIETDTGNVWLTDLDCKNLRVESDTGDLYLGHVIATQQVTIEGDTADVELEGVDGASLRIETDTGDVTGWLLSDKIFFVETSTGDIDIPKSTTGGTCEVKTDTGDIALTVRNKD